MYQLFVPKFRVEECLEGIRECLEQGWTGLGFKTIEFEDAWKLYTGLPYAHFLASNTVGLHLALEVFKREYNWGDDDEVITTPLTFVSTNHAILYAGLQPVFADVDDSLCLDPIKVLEAITDKTKAIMFVGMGGNVGALSEIVEIARAHNLKLILDAAHMAGTKLEGRHVGQQADVTVFSFQAVKNLPTADSGMICFKDSKFDEAARRLSWLGIDKDTYQRTNSAGAYKWKYEVSELGYKYHGNSIMASIGLVGLKYLDEDNAYRNKLSSWYRESLKDKDGIEFVEIAENCISSNHLFQILVKNRDEVMASLNALEIYPGVHYRDNTDYDLYSNWSGQCPNAARISSMAISLPMHLSLTRSDIERISSSVAACI